MPSDYDRITADNIRRRGEEFDDIGEFIAEQLYSDRTHFVYELIQNCEDAIQRRRAAAGDSPFPRSIAFNPFRDRLEVRHFGKPFDEPDVRGISDILKGTKRNDPTQIGKFGIGFKSVYSLTSSPEVHSGDEHFRITRYIQPCPAQARQLADGETLFMLPFNHKSVPADEAFAEISKRLQSVGLRTLLFVRHLEKIVWTVEDGPAGTYRRCEPEGQARRVVLTSSGAEPAKEDWLVFERPVRSKTGSNDLRVEVAYRLSRDEKTGAESVDHTRMYPLAIFFPTVITTGLGFQIQGPYVPTPPRDNIHTSGADGEWNRSLIQETATLVGGTLPILREMDLLSVRALEAMPIRPPEDEMFRPIFDRVRETLKEQPLLPAHGGGFVAAMHAKVAESADLRDLLSQEQLRQLFGAGSEWKWLSEEITGDLRSYLVKQLGVGEVTADSFARRFDERFIEAQPDEWVAEFYGFLTKRDVWKKGEPLRDKPFLRLESGRHVRPFGADGAPMAYLPPPEETDYEIVKRTIAAREQARQFLMRDLGLTKPDIVDEVMERILPRYEQGPTSPVSDEQHAANLNKIFAALKTDSQAKRQRLLDRLNATPFVRASNAATGDATFMQPDRVYMRTPELEVYFASDSDGWFLAEPANHQPDPQPDWSSIGVETKPRPIEIRSSLSWEEKRALRGNERSTGDIEDVDYDLDGLQHFLARFGGGMESGAMALVLWNFLLSHLQSSRYSFFRGRYRWRFYKERSASFDATVTKRLRATAWLPSGDGLRKPSEVSLADLPDEFQRDDELASALGMRPLAVDRIAREAALDPRDVDLIRRYPEEFARFRDGLLGSGREEDGPPQLMEQSGASPADFAGALKEAFSRPSNRYQKPDDSVSPEAVTEPERYRERTDEEIEEARSREPRPDLRFQKAPRTVWESKDSDVRTFLLEQYGGCCQVCGDAFRRRDGQPYFEGLYLVSRTGARWIDRPGNVLCLCATCCAKFQHGPVEADDMLSQIERFKALRESGAGSASLRIRLCEQEATIRFTERHLIDLQEMLNAS